MKDHQLAVSTEPLRKEPGADHESRTEDPQDTLGNAELARQLGAPTLQGAGGYSWRRVGDAFECVGAPEDHEDVVGRKVDATNAVAFERLVRLERLSAGPAAAKAPSGAASAPSGAGDVAVDPRMPRASLVDLMLGFGYGSDDDGKLTQKTRYGGFNGMGNQKSDGHGGVWQTRRGEGAWKDDKRGKSGRFQSGKVDESKYVENGEYHCVGALSTAFESMGLYDSKEEFAARGEGTQRDDSHWGREVEVEGKRYPLRQIAEVGTIETAPLTDEDKEGKTKAEQDALWGERHTADVREAVDTDRTLLQAGRTRAERAAAAAGLKKGTPAWSDFVLRQSYDDLMHDEKRDERLEGSALALQLGGMGAEVNPADVKPGDVSQQWNGAAGHCTAVQVVEATGVAKVDDEGKVSADGQWRDGPFSMDETTSPALVGAHIVLKLRRLGAHSAGGKDYNQGDARAHPGIYTREAERIGASALEFFARPSNSPWAGWQPSVRTVEEAVAREAAPSSAGASPPAE